MKKISVLLMIMLLVTMLAGCSNGGAESNSQAQVADGDKLVEEYLSEPLHIIVPYGAGGGADVFVRVVAKYMAEELGTEIVVDNKPGAGGVVASTEYLQEEANTRTLLYTNSSLMSYIPKAQKTAFSRRDFEPIISMQIIQFGLYSAPGNTGIETMIDLETYAKDNRVLFGSPGVGKPLHGSTEKILNMMGAENDTVTHENGNQGIVNLIGDSTQLVAVGLSSADQFVQEGTIVPLAVLSKEDYDGTYGKLDSVYKYGYEFSNDMLTMFAVRGGTDDAIVDRLHEALYNVTEDEAFRTELDKAQDAAYKVMDRDGINAFLDNMDVVSDRLLAE